MATLTNEQIEQKKQQLKQLSEEINAIAKELEEAGAWPLSDDELDDVAGGAWPLSDDELDDVAGGHSINHPHLGDAIIKYNASGQAVGLVLVPPTKDNIDY